MADVFFDTSPTAANAPAGTTAFRRIGSFLTNGSAQIIQFTQYADQFLWANPPVDINGSIASSTSASLFTLSVPKGVETFALGFAQVEQFTTGNDAIGIYATDIGNQASNSWMTNRFMLDVHNDSFDITSLAQSWIEVRADANSQIAASSSFQTAQLFWTTFGWIDTRGKA